MGKVFRRLGNNCTIKVPRTLPQHPATQRTARRRVVPDVRNHRARHGILQDAALVEQAQRQILQPRKREPVAEDPEPDQIRQGAESVRNVKIDTSVIHVAKAESKSALGGIGNAVRRVVGGEEVAENLGATLHYLPVYFEDFTLGSDGKCDEIIRSSISISQSILPQLHALIPHR